MEETREERARRKNATRQARFRERQRLKRQLEGHLQHEELILGAVKSEREANYQMMMSELDRIKEECARTGTPLFASTEYRKWDDKFDEMMEKGLLPKKPRKRKIRGFRMFPSTDDY